MLRDEVNGPDRRSLSARLDESGALIIAGQDLGPATAMISSDGEYEWSHTILAEDFPQLLAILDAPADPDVLDELEERWTGRMSYELERRIRESDLPAKLWTWSG